MKKTLSLILALLMSASCAATIFADEAVATSAIAEDAPAADEEVVVEAETEYDLAIEFLEAKKIMQGKGDGLLHAADAVKRYEMAILAARVATGWVNNDDWMNGTADNTKFTDLEGSGAKDALGALSYANQNGIVVGYGDGTFKPENTVTYRDALAIAVRTLGYSAEYPWGIIEKAVSLGLTEKITGVAYTEEINRGVAAQIIYNALFAKAASGKTLAMESFNCEYGWEKIVVVANEKVAYEADLKDTKDNTGISAFKLVNNDGTFSAETFYVADETLAFGGFYNALFQIDKDAELVDLVKAIEIKSETISNRGNDLETADAIGDFMKNLTVVEKYNVKNLSKDTLYNDEIIVKTEQDKTFITDYDYTTKTYAIDWETGDILLYDNDKDSKTYGQYNVVWYYNAEFEIYFRYCEDAVVEGYDNPLTDKLVELGIVGIDVMDEDDLAKLRDAIKDSHAIKTTKEGYYFDKNGVPTKLYSDLTVWNLDAEGTADYAIFEEYKFGKYDGINKDDKCGVKDDHKIEKYVLGGTKYVVEGTCDHHSVGGDHYSETYTWAEGFAPSEGFTGYVIYGVDSVKNELKIVKEIPAYSADLTEDTYVARGIVRAFDKDNKKITIGNETFSYDIDSKKLAGVQDRSAAYYASMFNQFVEYVVVDGKIAEIYVKGAEDKNFIVVEKYLGIDSDGYIVIQGYTTTDCKLTTFRIGSFDGWKQGSAFFYDVDLETKFVKGTIYEILSTDTSAEKAVYNVTSLGDLLNKADDISIKFEDNYRLVTQDNKTTTTKMNAADVYVIVGNQYKNYDVKPVYIHKGIADEAWTVSGKLLKGWDNGDGWTYIIIDAATTGFNADAYKVSFVAFADDYRKVSFDGYTSDYYYYGATEYEVKAFDLLACDNVTVKGYNLDLDANKIYATIDGYIVETDEVKAPIYDMSWGEFWTAGATNYAGAAYSDNNAYADFYFFKTMFTKAMVENKDDFGTKAISTLLSTDGADEDKLGDFFELKNPHDDLLSGLVIKEITLDNNGDGVADATGDLIKVGDAKIDWTDVAAVEAYCIYRASDNKVVVYLNEAVKAAEVKPFTGAEFENGLEFKSDNGEGDQDKAVVAGTFTCEDDAITSITLAWTGDVVENDTHAAVIADGFHFGLAGECTVEKWETKVNGERYYGSLVASTYEDADKHDEFCSDLAADAFELLHSYIDVITFEFDEDEVIEVTEDAELITISFTDSEGRVWNLKLAAQLNADGEIEVWFTRKAANGSSVSGTYLIGATDAIVEEN